MRLGATVGLIPALQSLGADPAQLLAEAGADISLFDNRENWVSYSARNHWVAHCVERTGCRHHELMLRDGNRRALVQRFAQVRRGEGAERIATIQVPTLILWGGRDRLVPLSVGRRFQADIAGSELVVFDDLGHVPQEEDPARTVAVVQGFLARR